MEKVKEMMKICGELSGEGEIYGERRLRVVQVERGRCDEL